MHSRNEKHRVPKRRLFVSSNCQRTTFVALSSDDMPSTKIPTLQAAPEPIYSDEELAEFYQNLLGSESEASNVTSTEAIQSPPLLSTLPAPADGIIAELEKRFEGAHNLPETDYEGLVAILTRRHHASMQGASSLGEDAIGVASFQPHQRLLRRLTSIIEDTEASYLGVATDSSSSAGPSSGSIRLSKLPISLALVSYKEWFEIIKHCVRTVPASASH